MPSGSCHTPVPQTVKGCRSQHPRPSLPCPQSLPCFLQWLHGRCLCASHPANKDHTQTAVSKTQNQAVLLPVLCSVVDCWVPCLGWCNHRWNGRCLVIEEANMLFVLTIRRHHAEGLWQEPKLHPQQEPNLSHMFSPSLNAVCLACPAILSCE